MKQVCLLVICAFLSLNVFAQVNRPTIIVVPSDLWCRSNGYVQNYESMDSTVSVPDYSAALKNENLVCLIKTLNKCFLDRGCTVVNIEENLKEVAVNEIDLTQDNVRADVDIIVSVYWRISKVGPKSVLDLFIEAMDDKTCEVVAFVNEKVSSASLEESVTLQEAVYMSIDKLYLDMCRYFSQQAVESME